MDKNVPHGAAILLAFIYRTETGSGPPECYEVIYDHNQAKLAKPLTSMTLGEVIDAGKSWTKRWKSSAAGAPQFMRATLQGLVKEMSLPLSMKLDGDAQDRLAFHLLKRRGYEDFMAGKISRTEFGKRLAQEWASFPVLKAVKGAHLQLKRGQSYYAGDALNKSLVSAATVEAVLDKVKSAKAAAAVPMPAAEPAGRTDAITIRIVQETLRAKGYTEVGVADGKLGKLTRTAILAAKNENDISPVNDVIDDAFLIALPGIPARNLPREDAEPAVVRQNAPEVRTNWLMKLLGGLGLGTVSLGGAGEKVLGAITPWKDTFSDIPGWVWLIAAALVFAGVMFAGWYGERKGIAAYQEGARR